MTKIPIKTIEDLTFVKPSECLSMYSSKFKGIVTDPRLMFIPIDDHLVHRGDGVFETLRVIKGKGYQMRKHLQRLLYSAQSIELPLPFSTEEIQNIIEQTVQASQQDTSVVRIFVSRGTGSFSVDPYTTTGTQLYVVVTTLTLPPKEWYEKGTRAIFSTKPGKIAPFVNIKSCNYLPNVLIKKEAIDKNSFFSIGLDEKQCITEGSTENILILTKEGELLSPYYSLILEGTTLSRILKLATDNLETLGLKNVKQTDITQDMVLDATEVMLCSTVLEVLPVGKFEEKSFFDFKTAIALRKLLQKDMGL